MYHIYCNGSRITSRPITLSDIVAKYGSVHKLESEGFILVKV